MNEQKKILILYQFPKHFSTLKDLCDNLIKKGLIADSFNVKTWDFYSPSGNNLPAFARIIRPVTRIPKLRVIFIGLLRRKVILSLAGNYRIVDINSFSNFYYDVIRELSKENKRLKITLWGSDFYRAEKEQAEYHRQFYRTADLIQVASNRMIDDFLKVYPECSAKMRLAHFGNSHFDIIDELRGKADILKYRSDLEIPSGKIIITCGHNGSQGQQHKYILRGIEKLPDEIKRDLFLLIPMTYGGTKDYILEIQKTADTLGIQYRQYTKLLSDRALCRLRMAGDIMISLQKSDAFSASIQEYLFSGCILIAGRWLPYEKFRESGIYFINTGLENFSETLSDCILNISEHKKKCSGNSDKTRELSAWDYAVREWAENYEELFTE